MCQLSIMPTYISQLYLVSNVGRSLTLHVSSTLQRVSFIHGVSVSTQSKIWHIQKSNSFHFRANISPFPTTCGGEGDQQRGIVEPLNQFQSDKQKKAK
jgi:hypothetical protein